MKKMLMLGGSHAEIPLINAAQKMGYHVITTGNQKDGLGHPYADEYISCDFSDKDAILNLARQLQVDAICSGCNDFAYLSTAYACEKMGLPGHDDYETALQIHHKDKYRALAEELGISTPKACKCYSLQDVMNAVADIGFPIIVKPVDLTGGKGMTRCEHMEQVEEAYHNAMALTREQYVVAEEFLIGTNHGFSAYLQDGKVTFYFVDNEQYFLNPYLVSGASAPGDVPQSAIDRLCKDSERIAAHLDLVDGIFHIQFILKQDLEPVIIEVCRRAPGDLYIRFVEMTKGMDYPAYIVAGETGMKMNVPACREDKGFYVRHCVMANKPGILKEVVIDESIRPYIVDQMFWYREGETIDDVLKYKAGIVFLYFEHEEVYRRLIDQLTDLITIGVV